MPTVGSAVILAPGATAGAGANTAAAAAAAGTGLAGFAVIASAYVATKDISEAYDANLADEEMYAAVASANAALLYTAKARGQGKGERSQTAKPDNPAKHARPLPGKPGRWEVKDPHTGKWKPKPPGWSPTRQ
jgi:hypothetical protein